MKKIFLKIAVFFAATFFGTNSFCDEAVKNFYEYILSNGMSVFVYEDFSIPTVRVEYSAKAGYAAQGEQSAPYFSFYAELFSDNVQVECNATASRFIFETTGAELKSVFERMSEAAFSPNFNDSQLQKKYDEQKRVQMLNNSAGTKFINAAINSRVLKTADFYASDEFPADFEKLSLSDLKSVLQQIGKQYYSPQNSALFVSGAVNAKDVFQLAEKSFGKHPPKAAAARTKLNVTPQNQKKFVLSHPEFSADMAQVVVQFTSLSKEQADIAATIFNNFSPSEIFIQDETLNIRGKEYLHAGTAKKNGLARLVFQTIMEESKVDFFEQCEVFEKKLNEAIENFSQEEFNEAKKMLAYDFTLSISTSNGFMNSFSNFWAEGGSELRQFLAQKQNILNQDFQKLKGTLQNETPWIFILLNDNKLQKKFAAAGYETVTKESEAFRKQQFLAQAENSAQENTNKKAVSIYDEKFVTQSKDSIQSAQLANGINITMKNNPDLPHITIALFIKGGEAFDSQENYGMQALVTNILKRNVLKIFGQKFREGDFERAELPSEYFPEYFVDETNSMVVANCVASNAASLLECFGQALLYCDFAPAEVDLSLQEIRSRQILKTGNTAFQLYSAGVKKIFAAPHYRTIYSTEKEILPELKYETVLEKYQKLLDATRIEIIAYGNFEKLGAENFIAECERVFGSLNSISEKRKFIIKAKTLENSALKVKLEHTFLTDISADKAGPRPAILVPTKDFSDPVQYWIKSPYIFEKRGAIFDALLLELAEICKKNILEEKRFAKMNVRIEEKSSLVSFGALTLFNTQRISIADALFEKSLMELKEKLFAQNADLNSIKSRWIKENYKNATDDYSVIKIIAKKIDAARLGNSAFNAQNSFTQDYEKVTLSNIEEYRKVFEKYFSPPAFKIYSADSKK